MMFRHFVTRTRPLHRYITGTVNRTAAKLKTLDMATKYTLTDAAKILRTVNAVQSAAGMLRYDITKARAQAIRSWCNKNGPIDTVDQLLEVDGFGVKNLDKFCASILRDHSDASTEISDSNRVDAEAFNKAHTAAVVETPSANRQQQFTTPGLVDSLRHELRTCTAIHVGMSSIAWAQLQLNGDPVSSATVADRPAQLLDWSVRTLSSTDNSTKRLHVGELAQSVLDVIEQVPLADVYVLESPRIAQQGPPGSPATININVQTAQIIGMVSLAMAARARPAAPADGSSPCDKVAAAGRVLFLRQLLASRLFQTVVGLERINTANVMATLLDQSGCARNEALKRGMRLAGELDIDADLQLAYNTTEGYCKEYMGQVLLMGLAFVRLSVLHCPASLAAVSRQKRK